MPYGSADTQSILTAFKRPAIRKSVPSQNNHQASKPNAEVNKAYARNQIMRLEAYQVRAPRDNKAGQGKRVRVGQQVLSVSQQLGQDGDRK